MKKLFTLGAFMLAAASAFAGSGKAFIPAIYLYRGSSSQFAHTNIAITNITDHAVTVAVKAYDSAGNLLPSTWVSYSNFTSSNTQIAGKNTANISIQAPPSVVSAATYGYAVIEWTNLPGDDDVVALVSHGNGGYLFTSAARESGWGIPVNNGVPF